jgi:2,3-diketo-5-methylthio-1-phosphopentane phosphatase
MLGAQPEGAGGDLLKSISLAPHASTLIRVTRKFSLAVFCDFDGTFSVQDVGSTLAERHDEPLRPGAWKRYLSGELSAWDYTLEILDGIKIPLPEVDVFLHTVDLDPGAIDLVDWCRAQKVPFRILSDGFDYNLNRLQKIHDVRFAFDANQLRFDAGAWRIHASARNADCECGTGNCKRRRIEALRERVPEATLVHIGNGRVSDTCGALAADVVFAKDSLALVLTKRGVHYEPYDTLHDVIARLEKLL